MASYASILLLSKVEFAAKLKDCQFVDLQGFCKAVSISAKGSRNELEARLLAFKDDYDSKENAISTPERRDGRKRSPYRGDVAAALREETEKCEKSTHLDLDDDSFADSGTATGPVIAPFPSDPLSTADPWRASIGTPARSRRAVDVHSGMSLQLQRERQTLDDFLAGIGSSMAPIPSPAAPVSHDTASVLQALLEGQAALLQGVNDLLQMW